MQHMYFLIPPPFSSISSKSSQMSPEISLPIFHPYITRIIQHTPPVSTGFAVTYKNPLKHSHFPHVFRFPRSYPDLHDVDCRLHAASPVPFTSHLRTGRYAYHIVDLLCDFPRLRKTVARHSLHACFATLVCLLLPLCMPHPCAMKTAHPSSLHFCDRVHPRAA